MILGAEEAGLLTQVNDSKPKSAERSPFWRVRFISLTLPYSVEKSKAFIQAARNLKKT